MNLIPYTIKLDEEYASIKSTVKSNYYNVRSLVVSVILIVYTILALGISINETNQIILLVIFGVKFFIFIIGIWIHYLNFYSLGFHAKIKKSILLIFAYLLALVSLGYFTGIAYLTFMDIIQQICVLLSLL